MVVLTYIHGVSDPLMDETETLPEVCEYINGIGEERIEKVIILDFAHPPCDTHIQELLEKIKKRGRF